MYTSVENMPDTTESSLNTCPSSSIKRYPNRKSPPFSYNSGSLLIVKMVLVARVTFDFDNIVESSTPRTDNIVMIMTIELAAPKFV